MHYLGIEPTEPIITPHGDGATVAADTQRD
jgi:hypothetical protein